MSEIAIDKSFVLRIRMHQASQEHRELTLLASSKSAEDAERVGQSADELAKEASVETKWRKGSSVVMTTFFWNRQPVHSGGSCY